MIRDSRYTWYCVCRLRVSLSAAHTAEDIESLAAAIKDCNLRFLPIDQVLGSPAALPARVPAKM